MQNAPAIKKVLEVEILTVRVDGALTVPYG